MSENPEEPRDLPPLRPVQPPEPPAVVDPLATSKSSGSGWVDVALGFGTAILCGLTLFIFPPSGIVLILLGIPIAGIILSVPASTRKFGLGMLLAFGIALLVLLAICGGAMNGAFR